MIKSGKYHIVILFTLAILTVTGYSQQISVNEPAVCLQCHDDFEAALSARHVHTPLKSGKCSQCHNPHASDAEFLLAAEGNAVCAGYGQPYAGV